MKNLYLGLVHYPVYNKRQNVVTTSITNLDLHDIARSCFTYGVKKFFVINPLQSQKELFQRILKFWKTEIAHHYNPDRVKALSIIEFVTDINSAKKWINLQEKDYLLISTSAADHPNQISYRDIDNLGKSIFLLFGTGNGLTKEIHREVDHVLEPIKGDTDYNHLSVRSAAAIVLDRIFRKI